MIREVGRQGSAVKVGKEVRASRFEPISAVEGKPQSDHNSLTNKPQMTAVQNLPSTHSAAKPQPDDTQTQQLHANVQLRGPVSRGHRLAYIIQRRSTAHSRDCSAHRRALTEGGKFRFR